MGGRQRTTLFMTEGKSGKEATKEEGKTPKKGKK